MRRDFKDRDDRDELDERVVDIARVAKVVKGGRHFSFRVIVVVGDNRGRVGLGIGKARGVPDAIRKAGEKARKDMTRISMSGTTIPHEMISNYGGAKVLIKLAAAGVRDVLTKSLGSANVLNVAKATLKGLREMKDVTREAASRGRSPADLAPFWERKRHG